MHPMSRLRFAVRVSLFLVVVLPGLSATESAFAEDEAAWALLKQPGYIVLLRHSHAPESPDDADVVDFKNCRTQRNLDAEGRAQARRIGDAFRKHGITRANLMASQYCRAMETARLTGFGPVRALPALNMVRLAEFGRRSDTKEMTLRRMKTLPRAPVTIMVTHVGNIQAIAGPLVSSGEMLIVRLDASGDLVVDGRIKVR